MFGEWLPSSDLMALPFSLLRCSPPGETPRPPQALDAKTLEEVMSLLVDKAPLPGQPMLSWLGAFYENSKNPISNLVYFSLGIIMLGSMCRPHRPAVILILYFVIGRLSMSELEDRRLTRSSRSQDEQLVQLGPRNQALTQDSNVTADIDPTMRGSSSGDAPNSISNDDRTSGTIMAVNDLRTQSEASDSSLRREAPRSDHYEEFDEEDDEQYEDDDDQDDVGDEQYATHTAPASAATASATTVIPPAADSSSVSSLGHASIDALQRRSLPPGWVYDIHGLPVSVPGATSQPNGALDVVVGSVPATAAPPNRGLPPEQISGVNSNPPGSTPLTSPGQTNDANANPMSPVSRKMEEVVLRTQAQLASQQQLQRNNMDRVRAEFTQQLAEAESRLARVHSQAS